MTAASPAAYQYNIRISPRARHINLKVTAADGLVVTVPRSCGPAAIQEVLEAKRTWIERSLAWAVEERQRLAAQPPLVIPNHIDLPALGETWTLELKPTAARSARVIEAGYGRLRLSGQVRVTGAATRALKRWLSRRARQRLVPRLEFLARRHGFRTGGASIRNQTSCWGSCSPGGAVSLNQKLLFLPPRLADYVLLHELCHTVHLDHSRRFWQLVARVEPDYLHHKRELAAAWDIVPAWAD